MRVLVKIHYVVAFGLFFPHAYSYANDLVKRCETIVYSANPDYAPYHWAAGQDRLEGASVELLAKLVPDGVKLKPVVYPWKRVLLKAAHGEIDLVLSLRKTAEREAYLAFTSIPSFPNPIAIFVKTEKEFPYNAWSDLKGKHGVISLGDRFGGGFDEYWLKELSVQETGTMDDNFRRVENGHFDYFITSQFAGAAFLKSRHNRTKIHYLKPAVSDEGLYFGFSKKSPCAALLSQFDQKLALLEKKNGLRTIINKYLNEGEGLKSCPKAGCGKSTRPV